MADSDVFLHRHLCQPNNKYQKDRTNMYAWVDGHSLVKLLLGVEQPVSC